MKEKISPGFTYETALERLCGTGIVPTSVRVPQERLH